MIGAFSEAVDAQVRGAGDRTGLGEMAQMAVTESLAADLGNSRRPFGVRHRQTHFEHGSAKPGVSSFVAARNGYLLNSLSMRNEYPRAKKRLGAALETPIESNPFWRRT
jgi:hypothetical protein